jgi:HlyD family secretion protein
MKTISLKKVIWGATAAVGLSAIVWFAWPKPVLVDLATVVAGPMEVTVDDDGKTNVRHLYTVYAPIAGKVLRISHPPEHRVISRHVGDVVTADQTIVAVMQPNLPGFVDVRSREQIEAEITAADAAVTQSEAEVRRLEAALAFARTEFQRAQSLRGTQTISVQAYDKAKFDVDSNEAALASARAQIELRRGIRESLKARLMEPSTANAPDNPACCVQIRAPVSGRVLKIMQESEAVVPPGTPLIELGDPLDLEVVADLLSTDAVQINEGSPVRIDGWGGPPVKGRVKRVDPAGFLKVSALGIEEQRVRVTVDFADPQDSWSRLGHDYRVTVHVTVWSSDNALTVPMGALFRKGDDWAVFAAKDGRARIAIVQIGHRNSRAAEVLSGLSSGDRVVLHPSDRVSEGTRISERETS